MADQELQALKAADLIRRVERLEKALKEKAEPKPPKEKAK